MFAFNTLLQAAASNFLFFNKEEKKNKKRKYFIGVSLFMTIFVVKTFLLQICVEKGLQMNIALM